MSKFVDEVPLSIYGRIMVVEDTSVSLILAKSVRVVNEVLHDLQHVLVVLLHRRTLRSTANFQDV
uniref:Uncharacterized protein n=1 Tax=Bionectria ochroleuca TaxID=29856 RepID=A0A8H7K5D9_BIOOC